MPHCVVAGTRIHYEVDGAGEPLVLIAGTAFDLSFWDDLLPELRVGLNGGHRGIVPASAQTALSNRASATAERPKIGA